MKNITITKKQLMVLSKTGKVQFGFGDDVVRLKLYDEVEANAEKIAILEAQIRLLKKTVPAVRGRRGRYKKMCNVCGFRFKSIGQHKRLKHENGQSNLPTLQKRLQEA